MLRFKLALQTMEEENKRSVKEINRGNYALTEEEVVVPVSEEFITVDKQIVETGKVYISKRVHEEEATINIPVIHEGYTIEHIPVKDQIFDEAPTVRHEGDKMIIPVIHEVVKTIIRYEVVEEIHVIKTKTEVPLMQQITLLKENVEIKRVPTELSSNL